MDLATARHDYTSIVQEEVFRELYDRFEYYRENRPVNNFSDAAALASLIRTVDATRRGESKELPIFYASSTLFESVLVDVGKREALIFETDNERLDLLVSPAFLVVRATLDDEAVGRGDVSIDVKEMLQAISEGPVIADFSALPLTTDYAESIRAALGYTFYERVWLPTFQARSGVGVTTPMADLAALDEQERVRVAMATVAEQLRAGTGAFRQLRDTWVDVTDAIEVFARRKLPDNPAFIDGLLRFCFPPAVQAELDEQLRCLRSGDRHVVEAVTSLVYRVAREANPAVPRFGAVAALLWILQLDSRLLALLHPHAKPHQSLRVLRGAAQQRCGVGSKDTRELVATLNNEYETENNTVRRAQLAIGIAYLDFHLAKAAGFMPSWESETPGERVYSDAARQYITEAVQRSRLAAACDTLEIALHAYATNQHLYYLVADGSGEDVVLRQTATRLTRYQYRKDVWQPRFDDTLGRYFQLRAHRESDEDVQADLLRWALQSAEIARGKTLMTTPIFVRSTIR